MIKPTKTLLASLMLGLFFLSLQVSAQISDGLDSTITISDVGNKSSHFAESISPQDLNTKGEIDASKKYKKYKGAAVGTLVVSLLSPLLGLIPAIACSATTPKVENLGYPDQKLFEKTAYHSGYTKKAKKIKSGKVWKNWGIGLGVNLAIVIIAAAGGSQ